MKTALILEGGAMRGMYTAGVLDVLMKEKIETETISKVLYPSDNHFEGKSLRLKAFKPWLLCVMLLAILA